MQKSKKTKKIKFTSLITKSSISRSFGGTLALLVFLLIVAALMLFPMILVVGNAFKPLNELWLFPPRMLPIHPTIGNFIDLFSLATGSIVPITRYFFNTVIITVFGTVGNILLASMCAYALAKGDFPGKNLMFRLIVFSLMFNATVTAIPRYLIMVELKWIDTLSSIIVPAMGSSLGLYLMKQFMEVSIPDQIIEASTVDGANQWVIFWKIVMPNTKPAWMTLMLFSVQSLWNMGASTYIFSEEKKTLVYALSQIAAGGVSRAGVSAATSVVLMAVPILIFIISQSNILETMATSGMKD